MLSSTYSSARIALAGPGDTGLPTSFPGPEPMMDLASDNALIYTTEKNSSLALGEPLKSNHTPSLRATSAVFIPRGYTPETLQEIDEASDSSDSSLEESQHGSSSLKSSSVEMSPSGMARNRPASAYMHLGQTANANDEKSRRMHAPGAPRIPFPPSPVIGNTGGQYPMHNTLLTSLQDQLPSTDGNLSRRRQVTHGAGTLCGRPFGTGLSNTRNGVPLHISGAPMNHPWYGSAQQISLEETTALFKATSNTISTTTAQMQEELYFHLPSGLLSPEVEMSSSEFTSSVRGWAERRQGGRAGRVTA